MIWRTVESFAERHAYRIMWLLVVAVSLIAVLAGHAWARWKPQYAKMPLATQQWFSQQHNANGQWCCNESDGHPFYGAYTLNKDGSVTLHLDTGPRTLPAYMVLTGPNPTGHAVWWYLEVSGGHTDYCFAPGTLT